MIPTLPLELYLFATHSATVRFLSLSVSFILSEEGDFFAHRFCSSSSPPEASLVRYWLGLGRGEQCCQRPLGTSGGGFRFLYSFIYLVIYPFIYLSVLGEGAVGDFLFYLGFD